jgi:hypothetical protein
MIGFVYLTTNILTNKKYIGKRQNTWNKGTINEYFGSSLDLKKDIELYGRENFKREILAYADTREELSQIERDLIIEHNAIERSDYYNKHLQGERFIPVLKQRPETIKKRADKMRGVKRKKYNRIPKPISKELEEQILKLYHEQKDFIGNRGSSVWRIHKLTGYHCEGIIRVLTQHNLTIKKAGWQTEWSTQEIQELVNLYESGISCKEISKITQRNISYISSKLKDLKITLRDANSYKI